MIFNPSSSQGNSFRVNSLIIFKVGPHIEVTSVNRSLVPLYILRFPTNNSSIIEASFIPE